MIPGILLSNRCTLLGTLDIVLKKPCTNAILAALGCLYAYLERDGAICGYRVY